MLSIGQATIFNKNLWGYNPLKFMGDSVQWHDTSESFIFSFENDNDTSNMKISRVVNVNHAMWEHHGNGFNFGSAFYMIGRNVYISNDSDNYGTNVIDSIHNYSFSPEEIEIFKINSCIDKGINF
jgi:hypothetical protein